jgi:antiviral helicase SKI2
LTEHISYKEAGEALRRKQDKEREAAGLPPVQRVGARGATPQRGGQRGGPPARGGPRGSTPAKPVPRGGGAGRTVRVAVDKNLYVHLLGHLRKKSLLPVVVFTFSKKRCEENAATLTNADLCTSIEKSEVHVAIEKALSRLKGMFISIPAFICILHFKQARIRNCLKLVECATYYPAALVSTMVDSYLSSRKSSKSYSLADS